MAGVTIDPQELDAVIFDVDGVVTDTASVHFAAWKETFNAYLRTRADAGAFEPFTEADYLAYVDGKPRYDGVRSFLGSRGIDLPEGDPDDPPERETIRGVGNRKNGAFVRWLDQHRVEPYPSTVRVLRELRERGVGLGVISASRNAETVLRSAGVLELFDARVDGQVADDLGLPGKPDPAVFLEAARRLDVDPDRAAIVEDAQAGCEAGRRGGFALVIGVDRGDQRDELLAHGADVVVEDLEEVAVA
ncbi:MAG: beta-phosphoglucomutase family hydrolase [Actinobacteria bacterium]|nr:beta-phosphoglucomutase family hydrolase [Actinomycetota bacterium]